MYVSLLIVRLLRDRLRMILHPKSQVTSPSSVSSNNPFNLVVTSSDSRADVHERRMSSALVAVIDPSDNVPQ